jgi:uncharacterized protein (TIGR02246 family)
VSIATRVRRLAAAVIACAMLSACAAPAQRNVEPEILAFVSRFIRAVNEANVDAFVACFSADATAFFPSEANAQRRKGRDAIRAAVAPTFSRGAPETAVTPRDLTVSVEGNLAYVTFDGGSAAMHARRTLVLRRQNGDWVIVHLHASNVRDAMS